MTVTQRAAHGPPLAETPRCVDVVSGAEGRLGRTRPVLADRF